MIDQRRLDRPEYAENDLYGFKHNEQRYHHRVYLFNPYKHRIIMETHFRYPKGVTFFYFPDGHDYHSLTIRNGMKFWKTEQIANIGKQLLWLNPNMHFDYFSSLMYELVHPSSPFIDHTQIFISNTDTYDRFCKKIFDERGEPEPSKVRKKFFFSPSIKWNRSEIMEIVHRVSSPLFGYEKRVLEEMKRIALDRNERFGMTTLATLFDVTPTVMKSFIYYNPELIGSFQEYMKLRYFRRLKVERDNLIEKLVNQEIQLRMQIDLQEARDATKKFDKTQRLKANVPILKELIYGYWKKRKRFLSRTSAMSSIRRMGIEMSDDEISAYHAYYMKRLKTENNVLKYLKNVRNINVEEFIEENFPKK